MADSPPIAAPRAADAPARPWGAIRSRTGQFYVRFTHDGKRVERGPFTTWPAADKMRRRARALFEGGTPLPDVLAACFGDDNSTTTTFREASESYLAHASTRKRASSLSDDVYRFRLLGRAPWAGKRLSAITAADLTAWADQRLKPRLVDRLRARRKGETIREFRAAPDRWTKREAPGASARTINKDLHLVSSVYRWAIRAGIVAENPVRLVAFLPENECEREVYLTSAECSALLGSCSPVLAPVVLAAIHTGMRKGELLALRWRSVDLDRKVLRVEAATAKSGRGRTVPLTPALADLLTRLRTERKRPSLDGSDPVFTMGDGAALGRSALRTMFEPTVDRCEGLPLEKRHELRFHDLRHTAASLMVGAGVPLFDVAKVLGHSAKSGLKMTMRYAHFAPEAGRAAVDALAAALAGGKRAGTARESAAR